LEPFYYNGVSYYSYRYFVFGGIILNSIVTLVTEKVLILYLTKHCDNKMIIEKEEKFRLMMEKNSGEDWLIEK